MICERCNKKKAVVFYRENMGGRSRALRLCQECTEILEQAGELEDMSTAISGFLSPLFRCDDNICIIPLSEGVATERKGTAKSCAGCGTVLSEISSTGKVGCAACYTAFSPELSRWIPSSNGEGIYKGKVSAGYRLRRDAAERLSRLKQELRNAVSEERYEQAVELRDSIRTLEQKLKGGDTHGLV